MKFSILGLLLVCTSLAFAQSNEGFWDNIRTTNETIILNAGKRKAVKTADFPMGTTEVVYRISLLDDNQKISSSLVSVLKAIPDPTGISQGAAGTVFLLSSISGDDKCKFYVFANENDALQYEKDGTVKNACVSQEEPVNKAAKLLTEKSKCLPQGAQNLWFGFQSDNWVMKEKIVLEVVPWVNYSLRSGWTAENRKNLLKEIEQLEIAKRVTNKNLFLGNFMEAIVSKYAFNDFKKLLPVEKAKAMDAFAEESLVKSGQLNSYLEMVRNEAQKLNFSNKTEEAILKIQKEIVEKNRATAIDYGLLGSFFLSSKQFVKAEEAYLKATAMNKTELSYQLPLAHIYMFTDRVNKSKDLHKKYQQNNLTNQKSWAKQTKIDFEQFKNNGFATENFKKILRVLD